MIICTNPLVQLSTITSDQGTSKLEKRGPKIRSCITLASTKGPSPQQEVDSGHWWCGVFETKVFQGIMNIRRQKSGEVPASRVYGVVGGLAVAIVQATVFDGEARMAYAHLGLAKVRT